MSKRTTLVSAIVIAALAAAVLGATAALRLIGVGRSGPSGQPLSEAEVRRTLDSGARPAVATPSATTAARKQAPYGTAGRPPAASLGAFSSVGGTGLASCSSGLATLTRWIPANGYSTDGYATGPAGSVWVKFKSADSELTVTITCVAGKLNVATSSDDQKSKE